MILVRNRPVYDRGLIKLLKNNKTECFWHGNEENMASNILVAIFAVIVVGAAGWSCWFENHRQSEKDIEEQVKSLKSQKDDEK